MSHSTENPAALRAAEDAHDALRRARYLLSDKESNLPIIDDIDLGLGRIADIIKALK